MAKKTRKLTVWDKARAYVEEEKGRKYDLEEAWCSLIAEWEYHMASAWDAGYHSGLRSGKKKK